MNPDSSAPPPPDAILFQMVFGRSVSVALSAIARLGVADHMSHEAAAAEQIAARANLHAPSLYRVLRLLASVGVFNQTPGGFALTPISVLLQSAAPGSLRNMVMMCGDEWITTAYQKLPHCLKTGGDGVTAAFGKHAFDLFPEIPEQSETFNRAMTDFTVAAAEAALEVFDFSRFRRLADVGGGHGVLLARILRRNSSLQGVLYDLDHVLAGAPATGHFAGCEERIQYEAGSFLERVPKGCDAYIMKHIIHDWDDNSCGRILTLMREQLVQTDRANGRVLLVEMIVPDDGRPGPEKLLDIEMLVATPGGKERTAKEYAALFAIAELELVSITPTRTPMCVIEARAAS